MGPEVAQLRDAAIEAVDKAIEMLLESEVDTTFRCELMAGAGTGLAPSRPTLPISVLRWNTGACPVHRARSAAPSCSTISALAPRSWTFSSRQFMRHARG